MHHTFSNGDYFQLLWGPCSLLTKQSQAQKAVSEGKCQWWRRLLAGLPWERLYNRCLQGSPEQPFSLALGRQKRVFTSWLSLFSIACKHWRLRMPRTVIILRNHQPCMSRCAGDSASRILPSHPPLSWSCYWKEVAFSICREISGPVMSFGWTQVQECPLKPCPV